MVLGPTFNETVVCEIISLYKIRVRGDCGSVSSLLKTTKLSRIKSVEVKSMCNEYKRVN
jgi:hypothetical protein